MIETDLKEYTTKKYLAYNTNKILSEYSKEIEKTDQFSTSLTERYEENYPPKTTHHTIHLRNISELVREQKDLALQKISMLLGNIHLL